MPAGEPTGGTVLRRALADQRRRVTGASLLGMAHQACEALIPVVIGLVIDEAVATGSSGALLRWLLVLAALFFILSNCYRNSARLAEGSRRERRAPDPQGPRRPGARPAGRRRQRPAARRADVRRDRRRPPRRLGRLRAAVHAVRDHRSGDQCGRPAADLRTARPARPARRTAAALDRPPHQPPAGTAQRGRTGARRPRVGRRRRPGRRPARAQGHRRRGHGSLPLPRDQPQLAGLRPAGGHQPRLARRCDPRPDRHLHRGHRTRRRPSRDERRHHRR